MNKKKKKDDFFDQMHNYRLDRFNRFHFVIMILMIIVNVPFFILCGIFAIRASSINYASFVALWVLFSFSMLLCLIEFIFLIQKNSAEFIDGKFSSGMIVFVISIIVAFGAIFTISAFLPNERLSLIPAIIAAVATLFAAVLALMGIHYSMMKKQEERMYKNKLVFEKDKMEDETIEYALLRDSDCNSIDVCIKNISNNFGFLCSIYRICGCDIYAIEERLPYFPIAPQKSYVVKNISYKTGDDQLILIYKDVEGKHYYMHLRILSGHNFEIMRVDLCNMSFISERLKVTKRMEEKLKSKKKKTISTKSEIELEETVSINKETRSQFIRSTLMDMK